MRRRTIIRTVALLGFAGLLLLGLPQVWLLIFVASALLGAFVPRLYCGWLCPINTVLDARLRLAGAGRGAWEPRHGTAIRAASVTALVLGAVGCIAFGLRLPLLPAILVVGIVVGSFDERLFHSYLCPFGNVQRLVPRLRRGMVVDDARCVSCGRCVKACPTRAIALDDRAAIDVSKCISCGRCQAVCPEDAIAFDVKRR